MLPACMLSGPSCTVRGCHGWKGPQSQSPSLISYFTGEEAKALRMWPQWCPRPCGLAMLLQVSSLPPAPSLKWSFFLEAIFGGQSTPSPVAFAWRQWSANCWAEPCLELGPRLISMVGRGWTPAIGEDTSGEESGRFGPDEGHVGGKASTLVL